MSSLRISFAVTLFVLGLTALEATPEKVLLDAIEKDNVTTIGNLIKQGMDMRAQFEDGQTAMHVAAGKNYHDIISLLLQNGVSANILNSHGQTPLFTAAEHGSVNATHVLIQGNVNINFKDVSGITALFIAIQKGFVDEIRILCEHGADVKTANVFGSTLLHKVCNVDSQFSDAGRAEAIRIFAEAGANVRAKNRFGKTPIYFAVENGYADTIRTLIEYGADANEKYDGDTYIYTAIRSGRLDVLRALVEGHADVNIPDKYGDMPIIQVWSLSEGVTEATSILIKGSADLEAKDRVHEDTPLCIAARKGDALTAQVLIEAHANVEATNMMRETPLYIAVINGNVAMIRLLMKDGANADAVNRFEGDTPLERARKDGNPNVIRALEEEIANRVTLTPVSHTTESGTTAVTEEIFKTTTPYDHIHNVPTKNPDGNGNAPTNNCRTVFMHFGQSCFLITMLIMLGVMKSNMA